MYRNLMPSLARRYRVIAPDYPGFGQSEFPPASRYSYTFEQLASTMQRFTEIVGVQRYALYIQDYGAPIGFIGTTSSCIRAFSSCSASGNFRR